MIPEPIIVTQPTQEPLTLAQARKHLRVTAYGSPPEHADDEDIATALTDARVWCENRTRRSFALKTYEIALDAFPCGAILLQFAAPLISVESIVYLDPEANSVTMDSSLYAIDKYQKPGWVMPSVTNDWPEIYCAVNAVKIRYQAGPDEDNPIEGDCLRAIKLVMGHFFENRENSTPLRLDQIPLAAEHLLQPHRLYRDAAA